MVLKKASFLFLAAFLSTAVILIWTQSTSGFKVSKVLYKYYTENFYANRFERGDLQQLEKILDQPFYFLGKGCQIYAFESEDGAYVLKVLKLHRYQPSFQKMVAARFLNDLSFVQAHQQKRLQTAFAHYRLAFDLLKEETALLYAHFDRSFKMPSQVKLIDRLGRSFTLDLNDTFFLVQRKADLFKDRLMFYKKTRQLEKAKALIDQAAFYLKKRLDLKVFDNDHPGYVRNLGVIGEQVISLDVGNFKQKKQASQAELEREYFSCLKRLEKWSEKNFFELFLYIQKKYQGAVL